MIMARAEERKAQLLQETIAYSEQRETSDTADLNRFIQLFFENVLAEDLLQMSPSDLYGAALAHYKLAASRENGAVQIRVYQPDIEAHGWHSPHAVVQIVNDDMPFLLDSVTGALNRMGIGIHLVSHPVMRVLRDDAGQWQGLSAEGRRESFIHLSIDEQADTAKLEGLRGHLAFVLQNVRAAVTDWQAMLSQLDKAITELAELPAAIEVVERDEAKAFLAWLKDNHFTLLGYAEYSFANNGSGAEAKLRTASGLGVLRDPDTKLFRTSSGELASLSHEIIENLKQPVPLIITKTDVRSVVHRTTHMDYIGVKQFNADGEVIGEKRFIGLFTSSAYNRVPGDIPLLRHKVSQILKKAGFAPDSHDGKALLNILATYPRDELFQAPSDTLYGNALGMLRLLERPRTRLFIRQDRFERFVSCLVFIARERFHTDLRREIGDLLAESFDGKVTGFSPEFGDEPLARVHFMIRTTPGSVPQVDIEQLETRIDQAARQWSDHLHEAILAHAGGERGLKLWDQYRNSFPSDYCERFHSSLAVHDIDRMEHLAARKGGIGVAFYRNVEDDEATIRFKLFQRDEAVPLSDCLPMLENIGLRVIGEHPYAIRKRDGELFWLHDFIMGEAEGRPVDLAKSRGRLEDLFQALWTRQVENDGFNKLALRADLSWREIVILRAYTKFLRQAAITYSQEYMERALNDNPGIVRKLIEVFTLRFDPENAGRSDAAQKKLRAEINAALDAVASLDDDRILRRFLNLIDATLRTNFFQSGADGGHKSYLSFKFDSKAIDELPKPRPQVEIFVYSPRVEGVHLRGGKVARGGLRWSDRREDFRTEVLGLVKAQQVKNAVIVPVGSKGGFVPKQIPANASRDDAQEEAIACYRLFISGLLDLTDNLVDNRVVPPTQLVRYDADDPYLVVAADKGTATFSDIANQVARDYGFWLDDAFASGGSAGYDHKKMGITARGAWEAVKRHFRELGTDIQTTPFTTIGCGDMSGDVFGNGMLLSQQTRLIAAFDHRDIFIDPDPDPAASYRERQRLFALPRSSWQDYDKGLISKGGGVFSRTAKSIPLTPEIQNLTGLKSAALAPNDLIRALLKTNADLLWFGGIGTYVKAAGESHLDVGDKANEGVRVDASELRVKVVGEGANLGCTQLARIEFAKKGGRINTDAVDNAAGVDCSDHEVNIKIVLGSVVAAGDMTGKQRDRLLADMTDEVAGLVLNNNYQQTLAISLEAMQAYQMRDAHLRYMRSLERQGKLDPAIEFLPKDEELSERAAAGAGLTRPEIAVLTAYAKNDLFQALLDTDVPDEPYLAQDLIDYFPTPLRGPYTEAIRAHRLRREISATLLANSVVNRMGPTFVNSVAEETGFDVAEILRAYVVARESLQMRSCWQALSALDNKVGTDVQGQMHLDGRELLRRVTIWFLRNVPQPLDIGATVDIYQREIGQLRGEIDRHLSAFEAAAFERRRNDLLGSDVPERLAWEAAAFEPMAAAAEMVLVARDTGRKIGDVACAFFKVGSELQLDWLRASAEGGVVDGHWERLAMNAMIDDLFGQQRVLTSQALILDEKLGPEESVDAWLASHARTVRRTAELMQEMRTGMLSVAKIAFVNRQVRDLLNK